MSILYFKPVGGEMLLHELDRCVRDRVAFLQVLVAGGELFYSQYLLEGSPYDNAGHFTLAIVSSLADNAQLSKLVHFGELKLLKRRLSYLKPDTLRLFAKKVLKYITLLNLSEPHIECMHKICSRLQLYHVAQHVLNPEHSESCKRHGLQVPFGQCLKLVANRKVDLSNGLATIPCGLWMKYLVTLYKKHLVLRDGLKNDLQVLKQDERIMSIVNPFINFSMDNDSIFVHTESSKGILLGQNVDKASNFFPPCMKNLHQQFREHHRLSHDQRFFYTCFLKDIGMPVSEAIEFWKSEYQQPSCSASCKHSWAKNSTRLIHGIRHTYGLEGARKSYSCVGCLKIQGTSGARTEGGCPFKNVSAENMKSVLQPAFTENPEFMSKISAYKASNNYSRACNFYLNTVFNKIETEAYLPSAMFLSPVKFYQVAMHTF